MHIYCILLLFEEAVSHTVVDTSTGLVRGGPSLQEDVEAFLGIPYAEPPVGELRFEKPVPKKKWNAVYNATKLPPPCIQATIYPHYNMPNVTNMSEDCLYLNVWAPKSKPIHGLRAIMFFIHPGSFVTGTASFKVYDGSNLASRGDVVVVTINYRLGILGFYLDNTNEVEGNMGIYDQIMALEWVKRNAEQFHGDPENIVLMGSSAGGAAVSAHLLSPVSKNLFKRAIIQSGNLLNPMFADNSRLNKASQLATAFLGCNNETASIKNNPQLVLECLKGKPQMAFSMAENNIIKSNPLPFYPRINDHFLLKKFAYLLQEGKFKNDTELLTGITEQEGSLMALVALNEYLGPYGENIHKMSRSRFLSLSKGALFIAGQHNHSEVLDFYLSQIKYRTFTEYTKMLGNVIGDFGAACPTIFFADFMSLRGNPVYFYKFGYRSPSTPVADWVGVSHLDELQYIFGNPYHQNFTSEEIELSHRLIDRWAAFARTGNPSIPDHTPWFRYSYSNPLYMNMGQEEENVRFKPNERCNIWRKRFDSEIDSKRTLI